MKDDFPLPLKKNIAHLCLKINVIGFGAVELGLDIERLQHLKFKELPEVHAFAGGRQVGHRAHQDVRPKFFHLQEGDAEKEVTDPLINLLMMVILMMKMVVKIMMVVVMVVNMMMTRR